MSLVPMPVSYDLDCSSHMSQCNKGGGHKQTSCAGVVEVERRWLAREQPPINTGEGKAGGDGCVQGVANKFHTEICFSGRSQSLKITYQTTWLASVRTVVAHSRLRDLRPERMVAAPPAPTGP